MASGARHIERVLWLALYTMIVLAPLAMLVVAVKPGARGAAVVFAAGLGFAGLSILVLQIVVSGRWPEVTSAFGLRSVLSLHRQAGMAALVLVIGHVVVLMIDDPARLALLDPTEAPLRARSGMAAVVAVLALAATSIWRKRLRISYERWRALHIVGAVIVLAGSFVHVIGVSAYLSLGAIRWSVLVLVVVGIGALFSLRVARPYARTLHPFRLRRISRERGGAVTVELEAEGHGGTRFRPGQFAWLKHPANPYGMDEHPFSYSSSADEPHSPAFTVKAIGDFTEALGELEVGSRLLLDGPHGEAAPDDPAVRGRLLLAAGIGITPAISVVRTAISRGDRRPILLVYGSRHWEDVTFREELEELDRQMPGLEIVHVLSRPHEGWRGERGRVDESLLRRVAPADLSGWHALVCGPAAMGAASFAALRGMGMPPSAIAVEGFG